MLRLKDIMTINIATATPDMPLREVVTILADNHIGGTPVLEGSKVVGVVSAADVLAYLSDIDEEVPSDTLRPRRTSLEDATVSEIMTREPKALSRETSVEQAAEFMLKNQIHRVLVMDGQKLMGMVTMSDVAKAVAEHRIAHRTYVFG
jgi:CBS domain-containing protein